jgi:hypothetical protein
MRQGTHGNNGVGPLSSSFDRTTPAAYARASGDPVALKALSSVERRAEAVRQRALNHFKNFEDRWTAKEAIRIWERHLAQNALHPAPPGVKKDVSPEAILKIASRNVAARNNRRLSKINAIKTRMSNALIRSIEQPSLRQTFHEASPVRAPTLQTDPRRFRRKQ